MPKYDGSGFDDEGPPPFWYNPRPPEKGGTFRQVWKNLTGGESGHREGVQVDPYETAAAQAAAWAKEYRKGLVPSLPYSWPHPCADTLNYLGWWIRWTGFKQEKDSERVYGQWLAHMKGNWSYGWYSSVPGICSDYTSGDIFDVSVQPGQQYVTHNVATDVILDMVYTALADLLIVLRSTTPIS